MRRRGFSRLVPALVAIPLLVLATSAGPAGATGTTTTPTASTTPAAGSALPSTAKKTPVVTFGLGPASVLTVKGKKSLGLDGRPYYEFFSSPGGLTSDHVEVVNLSTQTLQLNVYAVDAANTSTGAISYGARYVKPTDAGAWIRIGTPTGQPYVVLGPLGRIVLPLVLNVPSSATPGDHLGAIIVSLISQAKNKTGQIENVEQRVALRAFIRVSGAIHPLLAVDDLKASYNDSLNPFGPGSADISYVVKNEGNVLLGGSEKLTLSGLFGSTGKIPVVADVPLLLPGGSAKVSVHVKNVWPELLLNAHVKVSPVALKGTLNPTVSVASASVSFLAIPWMLLAVIVGLILIGWYLRWRAKRTPSSRHGAKKKGPAPTSDSTAGDDLTVADPAVASSGEGVRA